MRRGCVIFTVILALLIAVVGYFGYTWISDAIGVPEDLQPYEESAAALTLVKSKAPAPLEGTKLTERQVGLYIQGLDSVDLGLRILLASVDSIGLRNPAKGDSAVNVWKAPGLVRAARLIPLLTRRALVNFLNAHNLSLAEYEWIKRRTIAASGITQNDVDSLLNDAMPPSSAAWRIVKGAEAKSPQSYSGTPDRFFREIDSLRSANAIDSTEIAVAHPHRTTILRKGLASLVGLESLLSPDDK